MNQDLIRLRLSDERKNLQRQEASIKTKQDLYDQLEAAGMKNMAAKVKVEVRRAKAAAKSTEEIINELEEASGALKLEPPKGNKRTA